MSGTGVLTSAVTSAASGTAAKAETGARSCFSRLTCGLFNCCSLTGDTAIKGAATYAQRKTRDVLCLLIFVLFWVGMIIIGAIGLVQGNPSRLVYGTDYLGQVCGSDAAVKSTRYISYPRINDDFLLNLNRAIVDYKFYGICVSTCPGERTAVCNYAMPTSAWYNVSSADLVNCVETGSSSTPGVDCNSIKQNCWLNPIATSSTLFRCLPVYNVTSLSSSICVYPNNVASAADPGCVIASSTTVGSTVRPAKSNQIYDSINTVRAQWSRWFGDLSRAWWVILVCAVGVGLSFGFLFLFLAKWLTGVFVWGTAILFLLCMGTLTGYFYQMAGLISVTVPASISSQLAAFQTSASAITSTVSALTPGLISLSDDSVAYQVLAYVFTALTLILLCVFVALSGSINQAIHVIKLGARALGDRPVLILYPLITVASLLVLLIWWVFVAASLATAGTKVNISGDISAGLAILAKQAGYNASTSIAAFNSSTTLNATYAGFEDNVSMNYLLIYHFFGLLWTSQFVMGFSTTVVAGTVATWYFTLDTPDAKTKPATFYEDKESCSCLSAFCRTLRFGLGTIAFGSFIIAFFKFLSYVLVYLEKKFGGEKSKQSWLTAWIFCCIACCVQCIKAVIDYMTRHAFIYHAVKGEGFCTSGAEFFSLFKSNAATAVLIGTFSEFILFFGKVLIACGCGWVAYIILGYDTSAFSATGTTPIQSTWMVILATVFFAYGIASAFMSIFDSCIDAAFICYLIDIKENGTAQHQTRSQLLGPIEEAHKAMIKAKMGEDASNASKSPSFGPPASSTTNPTIASPIVSGSQPGL